MYLEAKAIRILKDRGEPINKYTVLSVMYEFLEDEFKKYREKVVEECKKEIEG